MRITVRAGSTGHKPPSLCALFDPENSKKEYLIECRSIGGKSPTNGWTVETAHILQLAENESTLKTAEQKLLQEDLSKSKKRKRDQQSIGSSAASKDLETQVKALHKENTRLRKMAVKEIPSLLAAVRTLISGKITESSSNGDETEYEASVALPSPPQPTSPKPTSVTVPSSAAFEINLIQLL
ncbi:uncharacterized protein LOC121188764 [Tachysurus ichikawai]